MRLPTQWSLALLVTGIHAAAGNVTAVLPSESLGNKVLDSDVELQSANNQFGAITIANYHRACYCDNTKECNEPPAYNTFDSRHSDFYDRTLEEQTTARVGAMMLLSRGCYSPTKNDGPDDCCPLKYTMMVDAIKRAKQESVTKLGLWDDNVEWATIRNYNKKLHKDTPFDFSDTSSWKYVFDYNYKLFFKTVPEQMWYRLDGKPVIAIWNALEAFFPKGRSHIGAFLQYIKSEFKKEFGVEPAIIAPKSILDSGSSAKGSDFYCAHDWYSASHKKAFTVMHVNGIQCGAMAPGYRDKCGIHKEGKSLRTIERNNGKTLAAGLSANSQSKFALMEGWNDVRESAGYYRSKAWSSPSLYINTVRGHTDASPVTLRLQAETADRFNDSTPENLGGEYQMSGLDIGRIPGPNGGWHVGWTEPGEWIEFPGVQLGCGIHRFTARCASDGDGNKIRLDLPTLSSAAISKTSFTQYENVHLGEARLAGGEHALRILFETGGVNIDWIFIKKVTSCDPDSGASVIV